MNNINFESIKAKISEVKLEVYLKLEIRLNVT